MNNYIIFKDRENKFDISKPVSVYRDREYGKAYSFKIKQGKYVIGGANRIILKDVTFGATNSWHLVCKGFITDKCINGYKEGKRLTLIMHEKYPRNIYTDQIIYSAKMVIANRNVGFSYAFGVYKNPNKELEQDLVARPTAPPAVVQDVLQEEDYRVLREAERIINNI